MITDDRNFKKSFAALSILLVFIILLASCSPDTSSYDHLFEGGRSDIDELPIEIDTFVIVLPSDISGAVYDATLALSEKISEQTLSDTKVIYDYEKAQLKSDDLLILVGKTNYDESQSFLRDFRVDDFGYTYSDRTVLICGVSEQSLLSAIEKFKKDIVLYADSEHFISNGTEYIFRAEYDIKRITLNGYQLCDYTLVYPNGNTDAFAAASYFRGILSENTGYYLDVKSDTQIQKDSRAICIGKTKLDTTVSDSITKGASLITEYPSGISVISDSLYTTKHALDSLLDLFCATDASASSVVQISSFAPSTLEFDEITITDIDGSALLSTDARVNTANTIRNNGLSLIRLSDISESTANALFYALGNQYTMISFGESVEKQIYYIYDSLKFDISYQKCDNDSGCDVYLVSCSSRSSSASLAVFELFAKPTVTQEIALSTTKAINLKIDTADLCHGTVFFEPSSSLDSALSNTLRGANRISEEAYSFGDGTFLDNLSNKNGVTNITLTLYR